jgi:hypothetical protein
MTIATCVPTRVASVAPTHVVGVATLMIMHAAAAAAATRATYAVASDADFRTTFVCFAAVATVSLVARASSVRAVASSSTIAWSGREHRSHTVGEFPVQVPLRWHIRTAFPSAGGAPVSSQVYVAIDEGSSSALWLIVTPVTGVRSGHGRVQSGRQAPSIALASPSSQNSAES